MSTVVQRHVTIPTTYASLFSNAGFAYGEAPTDQRLRSMILPDGWTLTGNSRHHTLLDQHDRRRIRIDHYPDSADVTFFDPDSHARSVAEHGDRLVLDTWATPGALLGVVGERIDAFQRLIYVTEADLARWADEQPETAARYRAQLSDYQRKLTAYTNLLRRLTSTVTSGWTPPWADLDVDTAKETRR